MDATLQIVGDATPPEGRSVKAGSALHAWFDRRLPSIAAFDERTRCDLVGSLHHALPTIVIAGGCAAGIAAIAGMRTGEPWFWIWAFAHLVVMTIRLLLRDRLRADGMSPGLRLHWYAIGGYSAAFLVGLGGIVLFNTQDALVRAMIPISSFAISAGAAARNSAYPRLAFGQVCLMLLPIAIEAFLRGTLDFVLFGVMVLAGIYAMMTIIRDSFRQTIGLVLAGRRHEALIQRLEEQTSAARAAADAKDRFLHEMSHELRTPLNAIIGFSDAIVLQALGPLALPANQQRYLGYAGDVRDSGKHLLSLVNRVLDLASHDHDREPIFWRDIDCVALLHSTSRMLAPLAEQAHVELRFTAADDLPRFISDELRLRQILLNLAGNAIRFTPSGGTVTARIDALPAGDALQLTVEDTGIGIAKRDLARVLEPFERAGDALHGNERGTGLGLALTKHLVDLLGGSLHLSSELGRYTRVEIRLPTTPRRRR
ncbi:sensor histidine kinase [Roseiterribacter gracilis]|uniref:histidine kinase n=1 Tax=Roseiterribacter gracilis TaxID=2812848 RepID=A0A8S8XF26_9PROT|nr:hypothetical protein TMPK1_20730 [Rhodospirillales bacterium TMPK1]